MRDLVMIQEMDLRRCSWLVSWSACRWNMWAASHHIAVAAHHVSERYGTGSERSVHLFLTTGRTRSMKREGSEHTGRRTDTEGMLRPFAKAESGNQGLWNHKNTRDSLSTADTGRRLVTRYHISEQGSADTARGGFAGETDHFSRTTEVENERDSGIKFEERLPARDARF